MSNITFTFETEKDLQRVKDAYAGLFPIPKNKKEKYLYTEEENIRKQLINIMRKNIYRWERRQASNSISLDETIIM